MVKTKRDPRAASGTDRIIGARIRERRTSQRVSQTQLADAIGVTFQQIQKYEKGVNRVAASTLIAIAAALNAPIASLLPESADLADAIEDSGVMEFAPLIAVLNAEGRRTLRKVARGLARDETLRRPKR